MMPWTTTRRKRYHAWTVLLLVFSLVMPPVALGDLESFEGRRIDAIEFEGNRTLAEETLLYYLGVEVGQTLDQKALNDAVRSLWETRLLDDLSIDAEASGDDGVKLVIHVVERPVMRSIDYVGLKRVSRTDIEERIAADRIQIFEGDTVRRGELRRLEAAIESLYREKGYRFADARYDLEEVSPNERRVVFTIDEGNRVRIDDIAFEGNTV
ncbi:MAG: hypothetical protein KDA28_09090, partial [Phycisphaerales bacterium]|nr:hypothetical protein [Phycisphaerales bacterium]